MATAGVGPHSFVGRVSELETLDGALAALLAGRGRLCLVMGEPGIGKTSLADELAGRAAASGVEVRWGRCWEGGAAPAYWPWAQVFRSLGFGRDAEAAEDLAPILPELADRGGAAAATDSSAERFRVFDAVAATLRRAAERAPLLLVFDDMHAADESSLMLLRFCARELAEVPVLMLCTYRDTEVRLQPTLARHFASLAREGSRLRLGGWDANEVVDCLRLQADPRLSTDLAPAIQRLTDGNPFFVKEIVREVAAGLLEPSLLRNETAPLQVPEGVRETIGRRLAPLPDDVVRLLRLASMIGREFEPVLLQRIAPDGLTLPQLIGRLALAAAAGLVVEPREVADRYAFSHALVREALRHDISVVERMSLHRAIAEAIEERGTGIGRDAVGSLAHHFFQAAAAGGAEKAIHYSQAAGDAAMRSAAYEDAAAFYQQGLDALRFVAKDERRRANLLIDLGRAQRRAGRVPEACEAFRRAALLARQVGDADLAARGALGFSRVGETGRVDADVVQLLQQSLDLLPDRDGHFRARTLARLAMALYFSTDEGDRQRREDLSVEALEMARRLGDPVALSAALIARHFVLWRPGATAERLDLSAELVRLAAVEMADAETELEARVWHAMDILEGGDGAGFEAEFAALRRGAEAAQLPLYRWHVEVMRCMWALAHGRVEEAEEAIEAGAALGEKYHVGRAPQFQAAQTFFARRLRRRLEDLEPALRAFAAQFAALPVWACGLALLYADIGRVAEAQQALAAAFAVDPALWPADGNWLPCLVMLAEVCAAVGDRGRAARIRDLLSPHAGTQVVLFDGIALLGPVDHFLGLLAQTLDEPDAARQHLEAAVRQGERLGAPVPLQRSRRALEGLAATRTGARTARAAAAGVSATAAPMVFRREGAYWTVAFGGGESRLKHSRGLFYLAHLLRHPGEEFHALELAAAAPSHGAEATPVAHAEPDLDPRRRASAGGDEVLDARARAEYRQRLRDLQEELDEAEEQNDIGRTARLRAEMQALTDELSRALGLGGRARQSVSDAERARIAVTKAITLALRAIEEHNPPLRRYFARTIKTGVFCGFRGDPGEARGWDLGR